MSKEEFVTRFLADQQARMDAKRDAEREAEREYYCYKHEVLSKYHGTQNRKWYTGRKFVR